MSAEMRALGLSVISILLTSAVIGNAYYQKKQFYPSVVYITKSNPSMAVSIKFYCFFFLKNLAEMTSTDRQPESNVPYF